MDSIWNFANAVKSAVVEQTESISKSLQTTDWSSELNALKSGIKSETEDFSQRARQLTDNIASRTVQAAKQIPKSIVSEKEKNIPLDDQHPSVNARDQGTVTTLTGFRDKLLNGTSELIETLNVAYQEHWKDATEKGLQSDPGRSGTPEVASTSKFSLLEAEIAAMEGDPATYCGSVKLGEEDEYKQWMQAFDLDAHSEEMTLILQKNGVVGKMRQELVPSSVDDATFWTRYFYKLQRLKNRHAKVAALATGLHASSSEQELGWESEKDEEQFVSKDDDLNLEGTVAASDLQTVSSYVNLKNGNVSALDTPASIDLADGMHRTEAGKEGSAKAEEKDANNGSLDDDEENTKSPNIHHNHYSKPLEADAGMVSERLTSDVTCDLEDGNKHANSVAGKHLDESEWDEVAEWE